MTISNWGGVTGTGTGIEVEEYRMRWIQQQAGEVDDDDDNNDDGIYCCGGVILLSAATHTRESLVNAINRMESNNK